MTEVMKGQIVRFAFEDGAPRCDVCEQIAKHCYCEDAEEDKRFTSIPEGTYITIRLDEDHPLSFWRVSIEREEKEE